MRQHNPEQAVRRERYSDTSRAVEAERQLIAHLFHPHCFQVLDEAEPLRSEWLIDGIRQRMWELLRGQHSAGKPLDLHGIMLRARQHCSADDVYGELERILVYMPGDAPGCQPAMRDNVAYWAGIVRDHAMRRAKRGLLTGAMDGSTSEEDVRRGLDGLEEEFCGIHQESKYKPTPLADLLKMDLRVEYLVHHTLVRNQLCVIGGPSKSLKTTNAVAMALALASGQPFLGRFDVPQSVRVGLWSAESGLATLCETAARIARAEEIPASHVPLAINDRLPRFEDRTSMAEWCRQINGDGIQVAFVDPLYRCVGRDDPGNLAKQGQAIADAADAVLEAGATPVFAHHTIKRPGYDAPLEITDIRDSGVVEAMRQWILISRRSRYQFDGRHELWISAGGSAGHSHCWATDIFEGEAGSRVWEIERLEQIHELIAHKQEDKQRAKEERDENDKWAALDAIGQSTEVGGIARTTLRDTLGWNTKRVDQAIAALGDFVVRTQSGRTVRYTVRTNPEAPASDRTGRPL